MTKWQWKVIIQLIRVILKLIYILEIRKDGELIFNDSDTDLLEEAVSREE